MIKGRCDLVVIIVSVVWLSLSSTIDHRSLS